MFNAGSDRTTKLLVGALLALPFLYLAVFYAYPIYKIVTLSLRDFEPAYGIDDFIGFENYSELLGDPETWAHIVRTFVYTFVCVGFSFVLGLAFALLTSSIAHHFSEGFGRVLRQIIITPMILIPAAAGVMWAFAYTEHYGWVNHIINLFGMPGYPWLVSDAAFYLVMVADVWGWTPFLYLILLAALQSLPHEPLEAARVDGASAWQTFWQVVLPMMRPVIVIAVTLKTLDTYRAFDYLWIMTKGGPGSASTTLNIAVYKTAFMDLQFGRASALGVITMIFPVIVVAAFLFFRRREVA